MLPKESPAQRIGRVAEALVTARFSQHGWIVMHNKPGTDFGVDLAAFRRSDDDFVLPHALSVQVKGVDKVKTQGDAAVVSIAASTLSSWMWSRTPTICVVVELATERCWWSTPAAALASRLHPQAKTRSLRIARALDSPSDWQSLSATVEQQWNHLEGVGALLDVALVLQLLTDVALDTELWTRVGDYVDTIHHAAAVHTFRTICSANALAGRIGSSEFITVAAAHREQVYESWTFRVVERDRRRLGFLSGIDLQTRGDYILDVFGRSGTELAAAIPRLQQISKMPELGVPLDAAANLDRVTASQLRIIDPDRAALLESDDFDQQVETHARPLNPVYDSRAIRPMVRPRHGADIDRDGLVQGASVQSDSAASRRPRSPRAPSGKRGQ